MNEEIAIACACMGPREGEILCPCAKRYADFGKLEQYLHKSHALLYDAYWVLRSLNIDEKSIIGGKYIKIEHLDVDKIKEMSDILLNHYRNIRTEVQK